MGVRRIPKLKPAIEDKDPVNTRMLNDLSNQEGTGLRPCICNISYLPHFHTENGIENVKIA